MLEEGERLMSAGRRDEAHKLLTQALARARQEKNPRSEAWALSALGRNLSAQGKYTEAIEHLRLALAIVESLSDHFNIGRIANSIGAAYHYLGQREDAARAYRQAISAFGQAQAYVQQADTLINLALVQGKTEDGREPLSVAAEIGRRIGNKTVEARALHALGDRLFISGDFGNAMEHLERAERLYTEAGATGELAGVYTSMGRLHRHHGLYDEAISYFEKALAIDKKSGNAASIVQSTNALAVAYDNAGNDERAGELYAQALTLARQTDAPRLIRFMLGNYAGYLIGRGLYAEAVPLLEEVLRGPADVNTSVRHAQLGTAYASLGRFAEAEQQFQLGIEQARRNNRMDLLPSALYRRAVARARHGEHEKALADLREVTSLIEERRSKLVPTDFMKQGFARTVQGTYSLHIYLLARSGDSRQALDTSEMARSRAFLDLLATRDSSENPVAAPSASGGLTSLASATPHRSDQVAATAARLHAHILSYWTSEDTVFIWVIRPDGRVEARSSAVNLQRLARLVRLTQSPAQGVSLAASGQSSALAQPAAPQHQAWRELYDLLIRPVRSLLPASGRLTIVPHGPLLRLSFAALQNEKGRYLIEDFTLHYSPSATLLEFTARRAARNSSRFPFLIVADPLIPPASRRDRNFSPLPGAREEGRAIARLLPEAQSVQLDGPRATKSAVLGAMPGKAVVHLATHSLVRDDAPFDSFIALARGDENSDGRLYAREVYSLGLQAQLVVLSSCRSGAGEVTGDGIASLARAFFYAGSPSLIVTLWDIADQPAGRLLPEFYRAWLDGRDKSQALRAAQLRLLRDLRAGRVKVKTPAGEFSVPENPAFWASFILLGEP